MQIQKKRWLDVETAIMQNIYTDTLKKCTLCPGFGDGGGEIGLSWLWNTIKKREAF
jgi:hypothetical protein